MNHHLTPEEIMHRCLALAAHGAGRTSPNPMVGAALVHDGRIVGEGYHHAYGGPHAEVEAVKNVLDPRLLSECTLYVTLEPCSHFGKTPPCADLIIHSKIPKVVIAARDPNALVSGGGIKKLEAAGIDVEIGLLEQEARELNRGFFSFHESGRPWIILKWAQTSDGFMAREDGTSKWISNEASRKLVHSWRAVEDAVLVGGATALRDDPELTVRLADGRNPLRVLLDTGAELPASLKLFNKGADSLVLTSFPGRSYGCARVKELKPEVPLAQAVAQALYDERILTIIIEGGAKTLSLFVESNLWDEARVFISKTSFGTGLAAPSLNRSPSREEAVHGDRLLWFRNGALPVKK